jgi:hypothetical protein
MNKKNTIIKECPDDKILNPDTNRCVSKSGSVGKKILLQLQNVKTTKKINDINKKECPPDKILNPQTDRCVSKTGAIGKKILLESNLLSLKKSKKEVKEPKKEVKEPKKKEVKEPKKKEVKEPKKKEVKEPKKKEVKEPKKKEVKEPKKKEVKEPKKKEVKEPKKKEVKEPKKEVKEPKKKEVKESNKDLLETYKANCESKFGKANHSDIAFLNKSLHFCMKEKHEFLKDNFKKFIEKSDKSIREYLEIILNKTIYVSLDTFLEKLTFNIYSFINNYIIKDDNKNRIICLCTLNLNNKNRWIFNYVIYMIKFITNDIIKVQTSNSEYSILDKLNKKDILMFVDDCYYHEFNFTQTLTPKYWKQLINCNDIIFYFMVPYMSTNAMASIKYIYDFHVTPNYGSIVFNENITYINEINTYIDMTGIKLLNLYYSHRSNFTFGNKCMIYFQHNIENENYIIKPVYLGIIANAKNGKLIKDSNYFNLSIIRKKEVFNMLDKITIINNCNTVDYSGSIKSDCEFKLYTKINDLDLYKNKSDDNSFYFNDNIDEKTKDKELDKIHQENKMLVESTFGKPDKDLFNSLKKHTFNLFPLDHSFDENAIKKFISESNNEMKDIAKKIFANTKHISFEKFILLINKMIYELLVMYIKKKYHLANRPIHIYLNASKRLSVIQHKSNYWLYKYVKQFIMFLTNNQVKTQLINSFDDITVYNSDTVILIDDCIYSGEQMSTTISNIINKNFKGLFIFLVIPFISNIGNIKIHRAFKQNMFLKKSGLIISKYTQKPLLLKNVLSPNELLTFFKYYGKYYTSDLDDVKNLSLIYFDHKLADVVSTLTPFYVGVVPSEKNYKILSKQVGMFNTDVNRNDDIKVNPNNKLDVIPVIKNCDNYTYDIDLMRPNCPAPPYKKTFKKFIENIKKNNKNKKYNSLTLNKNVNKNKTNSI